jgi:chemotaxis protein MotB
MVSFADMITIMMSFFVIMFALAAGEAAKGKKAHNEQQQAALDSLQNRFGPKYQPFSSWGLMPGNSPVKNRGTRQKVKLPEPPPEEPESAIKVPKKGQTRIRIPGQGEKVVIGGALYFGPGNADLPPEQKARLKAVAAEMAGKPQEIEVVGHASPQPLPAKSAYRDRWDLAYARCRRVAEALAEMKVDQDRVRLGVVRAEVLPAAAASGQPTEDCRVDIYLDDALAGKYRRESEGP